MLLVGCILFRVNNFFWRIMYSRGPQSSGYGPPPGLEPFGTGPRKWWVSACTSPIVWTVGEHACSICMSGGYTCLLLVQMELCVGACGCQLLMQNHPISSPHWSAEPKRLENSMYNHSFGSYDHSAQCSGPNSSVVITGATSCRISWVSFCPVTSNKIVFSSMILDL